MFLGDVFAGRASTIGLDYICYYGFGSTKSTYHLFHQKESSIRTTLTCFGSIYQDF